MWHKITKWVCLEPKLLGCVSLHTLKHFTIAAYTLVFQELKNTVKFLQVIISLELMQKNVEKHNFLAISVEPLYLVIYKTTTAVSLDTVVCKDQWSSLVWHLSIFFPKHWVNIKMELYQELNIGYIWTGGGGGHSNTSVIHMRDQRFSISKHTLIERLALLMQTPLIFGWFHTQFYPQTRFFGRICFVE